MADARTGWVDVEEARRLPGLRLVLSRGVPGPWGETAKAILHVKRIPYVRVAQEGGGDNAALRAWTGHANAPTAVLDDERPRAGREEILYLAERLAPQPALIPADAEERIQAFGLWHEIAGELGFGWCRRLMMIAALQQAPSLPPPLLAVRDRLTQRYGGPPEQLAAAPARAAEVMRTLAARLHAQRARGSELLVGDALSVADLAWACFAALLRPLPAEQCPMPDGLRASYTATDPVLLDALDPILLEHRDRIYARYLELPISL